MTIWDGLPTGYSLARRQFSVLRRHAEAGNVVAALVHDVQPAPLLIER